MTGRGLLPRFRSGFQQQLFLTIAGLLVVAMLVAGSAVSVITTERLRTAMEERLQVGLGVLTAQLRSRAEQLENSVKVLTSDFGFIGAVATRDEATVASALDNHGQRIGADFLLLTDVDGRFLTASADGLGFDDSVPFASVLANAQASGQAYAVVAFDGGIYQLFLRSVKAPNPVAWVYMGFALDAAEAQRVSKLTQLEVSFVDVSRDTGQTALISTLEPSKLARTMTALAANDYAAHASAADLDERYLTVTEPLSAGAGDVLFAMLQTPLAELSDTRSALLTQLAVIVIATLGLCLLVSGWLAGQLSRPIDLLTRGAKRIHQGNYTEPVAVQGHGDLALLGDAFNSMVSGIADREERIRKLAYYDHTTGAPNKLAFTRNYASRLDASVAPEPASTPRAVSDAQLRSDGFVLCLFSLINAREISFNLGFENGEQLMRAAVEGLRTEIREEDDLYAFRADQYALVLPGITPAEAQQRVRYLVDKMNRNYTLGEWTVTGRAAAAIVSYPEDADELQTLLRRAEVTLDQAITAGQDTQVYVPGQEEGVARRLHIIGAFDQALADSQFSMVFQPKIDIASNQITDCEALLRWIHPELGFIPPDEFILLAEQAGKMQGITDFVLDTAIAQAVPWYQTMGVRVAINLSARDVGAPDLDVRVRNIMRRHGATGEMLTLEVTESAVLDDKDAASAMLEKLRALGVRLSIDDYGTGYSSLSQLKHLPVDELKIDMAFVLKMDTCSEDAMIVKSTVELGHNMNLSVVAEGVENEASLALLRQYGCDKAQGYHFAKPMPALEFEQWCTTFREQYPKLIESHG